jgi:hypothetical protein
MDNVIEKLTPEQALEALRRLSGKGGAIQDAVLAEAMHLLGEIDLDKTAEEVFVALDLIDVEDCWKRAGRSRNGYTSPDEAAVELIEEELQPFFDQAERYHELGMHEEGTIHCMGVVLGIYRYAHESKSEFKEWAVDIPIDCAGALLTDWRERGQDSASLVAMDAFIEKRCRKWAAYLIPSEGHS